MVFLVVIDCGIDAQVVRHTMLVVLPLRHHITQVSVPLIGKGTDLQTACFIAHVDHHSVAVQGVIYM